MKSDVGMQGLALARVQDEVPGQSQGGSFGPVMCRLRHIVLGYNLSRDLRNRTASPKT